MTTQVNTRKLSLAIVLTALAIVLSPIFFPVGPTKTFPWQHMVNAIAGVLLGPWYAALMATAAGVIRNMLGVGTVFAFPGGIPGALVVGIAYHYLKKDYAALMEVFGTGVIGALLSALLIGPSLGMTMTVEAFIIAFSASSIPGSILGYMVLLVIRRIPSFSLEAS
jgi:energy coupling factor transporter S component ThiW